MALPEGWLTLAEARELGRLAKGKVVLELGAWKGRSTVALARAASFVVSVDAHRPWKSQGVRFSEDSLPDYLKRVRRLHNVAIVVADFSVSDVFAPDAFELVFVDGAHDFLHVVQDVRWALRFGCTIAAHDWGNHEVKKGIEHLGLEPHHVVDSVAVFEP